MRSNLYYIQVHIRIWNTMKKLLRRWCSKSCIQFNQLSINFFSNFIIRLWFLVTSREVKMGKSNVIWLFKAFIFVQFIQVDRLKIFYIFPSKKISNLDDIWPRSMRKTLIKLIGCSCTKYSIQLNKLRIKFLIQFIIWIRFAVTLRDINMGKSNIVPLFNEFIVVHSIQIDCLK